MNLCNYLNWSQRYFLLWQEVFTDFSNSQVSSEEEAIRRYEEYDSIFQEMLSGIMSLSDTDENETCATTDTNRVYIFITQFLNAQHAPTAKALSVARFLLKAGYQPVIINTAEMLGGQNPGLENAVGAHYIDGYSELKQVTDGENLYPFVQFPQGMPNEEGMIEVARFMKSSPAKFVVSVGDMSLVADLAGMYSPLLCINTMNRIGLSHARMQAVGRRLSKKDTLLMQRMNLSKSSVMTDPYIYELPRLTRKVNREERMIPKDCFLLGVAGNRLDSDLTDDFLCMLDGLCKEDYRILIIGTCEKYEMLCERFPNFKANCIHLPYQEDLESMLSLCDLYLNPRRQGGGTACVMTMNEGVPVVSIREGDGAIASGEYFCVDSYEEMQKKIELYHDNAMMRSNAGEKAKQRARFLTDVNKGYEKLFSWFIKGL